MLVHTLTRSMDKHVHGSEARIAVGAGLISWPAQTSGPPAAAVRPARCREGPGGRRPQARAPAAAPGARRAALHPRSRSPARLQA